MRNKYLLLWAVLGGASFNASACYIVYDRAERVVYQSQTPPVDMSRPLHETLPSRFPGGHMIFDTASECQVISSVAAGGGARDMATRSPLLTDERTAVATGMPHTTLAGGIALVQPRNATLAPGLTVLPSTSFAAANMPGNTAVMGAGPRPGPVITELRDPPVVIEQSGGKVIVREAPR
jgi:hypothetical protein